MVKMIAQKTVPDSMLNMNRATAFFMIMLNRTRTTPGLVLPHNSNTTVTLDPKIRTKFAMLAVLTTRSWMRTYEIDNELRKMGYTRSRGSIRRALSRLVKFGLAEVMNLRDRYNRKAWRLTQRGLQYASSPQAAKAAQDQVSKATGSGTPKSSKGSSGGTSMCIDPNKPTLNKAIEKVTNDLIVAGKKFSAYDVTSALREEVVKDGSDIAAGIDIAETGVAYVGNKGVPRIGHDYVRDAVHELFHQGKMDGYDRYHTGTYWEYGPENDAQQSDPDPSADPVTDPMAGSSDGGSYDGTPTL